MRIYLRVGANGASGAGSDNCDVEGFSTDVSVINRKFNIGLAIHLKTVAFATKQSAQKTT